MLSLPAATERPMPMRRPSANAEREGDTLLEDGGESVDWSVEDEVHGNFASARFAQLPGLRPILAFVLLFLIFFCTGLAVRTQLFGMEPDAPPSPPPPPPAPESPPPPTLKALLHFHPETELEEDHVGEMTDEEALAPIHEEPHKVLHALGLHKVPEITHHFGDHKHNEAHNINNRTAALNHTGKLRR